MHKLTLSLALSSLIFAGCSSTGGNASMEDMSPEAIEAAYMRVATPGDAHRALDPFVGAWNASVTMWMAPNAPPETMRGTMVNSWILDGHHVEQRFTGEIMGQPFAGIGTMGFDNAAGKYFGTWMDSMSTQLLVSSGEPSTDGKTFQMAGTTISPITLQPRDQEHVTIIEGPNRHTFTSYDIVEGKRVKTMEIVYDRVL